MKLPVIQQLGITAGVLAFDEQRRGLTLEAAVNAREAAGGAAGFLLDGRGTVNGSPLTLKIEGGPFINIRRNRPYRFEANVSGAGSSLTAKGAITRPFDLGRFDAALTMQGRDLSDLYLLTGVTLPNTPQYRLSGALNRNERVWTFKDFDGRVGASDLSGEVRVDAAQRLRVDADLRSRRLDIDDLAAVLGAKTRTNAAGTETEAPVTNWDLRSSAVSEPSTTWMVSVDEPSKTWIKLTFFENREVFTQPVSWADCPASACCRRTRTDVRRDTPCLLMLSLP